MRQTNNLLNDSFQKIHDRKSFFFRKLSLCRSLVCLIFYIEFSPSRRFPRGPIPVPPDAPGTTRGARGHPFQRPAGQPQLANVARQPHTGGAEHTRTPSKRYCFCLWFLSVFVHSAGYRAWVFSDSIIKVGSQMDFDSGCLNNSANHTSQYWLPALSSVKNMLTQALPSKLLGLGHFKGQIRARPLDTYALE